MAQDVIIRGTTYQDVPSVQIPLTPGPGNALFVDTSDATLDSGAKMLDGVTAYANGTKYTGSIETNTGSDLSASGATVTVPAGYYAAQASKAVASGSSKNTQVVQSTTRTSASTLTAIGAELTVSKTGTYDIYYSCFRTNTSSSYTWATRLYINGAAYGTAENTTWTNNQQNTHLSNISLTVGDKLRVYGCNTRGTSYYVCAPILVIIES